jgi:tetratricopeptide (TPR) repeat protein
MKGMRQMDTNNPVIQLCIKGTQAEFAKQKDEARGLYQQAWQLAKDDYEACIAAHYMARLQDSAQEELHWNQEALDCATRVKDARVKEFYPSLFLNMGHAYERIGRPDEAKRYYDLALQLGAVHHIDL